MPIFASDVDMLLDICFNYDYLSFIRLSKDKCVTCNENNSITYGKWNYLYKKESRR